MKTLYLVGISALTAGCASLATPEGMQATVDTVAPAVGAASEGDPGILIGLLSGLGPTGQAIAAGLTAIYAIPRTRKYAMALTGKAIGMLGAPAKPEPPKA